MKSKPHALTTSILLSMSILYLVLINWDSFGPRIKLIGVKAVELMSVISFFIKSPARTLSIFKLKSPPRKICKMTPENTLTVH